MVQKQQQFFLTEHNKYELNNGVTDFESEKRRGNEKKFNPLGADIIKAFGDVDPKNKKYYNNKTQREACDFLLDEYGLNTVKQCIAILPQTNKLQYFPMITSPVELRDKWVKLQDAIEREKNKQRSKAKVAFV